MEDTKETKEKERPVPRGTELRELPVITPKVIEDFIFSSNLTKLSAPQRKLFIAIAIRNQLDPFKREIHAVPYWNSQKNAYDLSIVTGYETYLKRAERSNKLNGWKCWTEGTIKDGDLRAVIEIERKDWNKPLHHEVEFNEYNLDRGLWKTKPKTMIKKVAMAQAFRLAFPEDLGGLPYTADEIDTGNNIPEQIESKPELDANGEVIPPMIEETHSSEVPSLYFEEVKKHLEGYKNLFELRNGFKKHYHEWKDKLISEEFERIVALKDELKAKFEK